MMFRKYPHLEKWGRPEVEGIEDGECLVFPKLDGTNGSMWVDYAGHVHAASRRRELGSGADNHGFWAWANGGAARYQAFLREHPNLRLYGEWLVPHTFTGYRDNAWRRFWVFDVYDDSTEQFLHWDAYGNLLMHCKLDVVHPLCHITNPVLDQLLSAAEANHFLCRDGAGPGEGIVLKRYDFTNRYGRTTWAKLVRNEFKDAHTKAKTPVLGERAQPEVLIARAAVTQALVDKERHRIAVELQELGHPVPRGKLIPRLLETVYHCVVVEELWAQLKKLKDPTVDFKKLRRHVIARTKQLAPDLF